MSNGTLDLIPDASQVEASQVEASQEEASTSSLPDGKSKLSIDADLVPNPEDLALLPPPLSHETFHDPSFTPSDFLLSRRHTPLDVLRSELREHLNGLRAELVGVINEDYEDFIGLGMGLRGEGPIAQGFSRSMIGSNDGLVPLGAGTSVDVRLRRMKKPLHHASAQVAEVRDVLVNKREELLSWLTKRETVRQEKAALRLMMNIGEAIGKVEKGLWISTGEDGADEDADQMSPGNDRKAGEMVKAGSKGARKKKGRPSDFGALRDGADEGPLGFGTKRIERVAADYNQMLYLVEKGRGYRYVDSLNWRIDRIKSTLERDLSSLLTTTLHSSSTLPDNRSTHSHSPSMYSSSFQGSQGRGHTDGHEGLKLKRESLTECLRTYASIGKWREAEEVIRREVVRPFVLRTIRRDSLSGAQSPVLPITPFVSSQSSFTTAQSTPPLGSRPSLGDEGHTIPTFYSIAPVSNPRRDEEDPLVDLFNKLLSFISRECILILDISERKISRQPVNVNTASSNSSRPGTPVLNSKPNAGKNESEATAADPPEYRVLANVIWDEIGMRLMGELGHSIFAAGRPDIFHQNYTVASMFISRIESLCPTQRHLISLREHPTYLSFSKRWQTPVYFQLRFNEIVGKVEETLSSGGNARTDSKGDFLMAATDSIHKAIRTCWADEVYLPEVAHRFWKLTLQLLSRYRTWLDQSLPEYVAPQVSQVQQAGATARSSFDSVRHPIPSAGTRSPSQTSRSGTPLPPNSTEDAQDDAILRQLTVIISDSLRLQRSVLETWRAVIKPKLASLVEGATTGGFGEEEITHEALINAATSSITSLVPSLSQQVITILIKRCSEPLRLVRSVASQVRASTKRVLSEPSYFVSDILKPLKTYIEGPGKVLEGPDLELRNKWATEIVEDVATKYAAHLLATKKTADSLNRWKKGRQGFSLFGAGSRSNADEGTGDEERVKQQMQLDVNQLGKDAMALGVDVGNSAAFDALRASIVQSSSEADG